MQLNTKELKTISVLYVEDDEFIRTQTVTLFKKLFKKVFSASNGVEGLAVFKNNKNEIDIVVTDINMPSMNGLEMIKQINIIESAIPTVVTTAHTDPEYMINAIDNNVDKYIPKPVQVKELTTSIVTLVIKYRKSNKLQSLAKGLVVKSNNDDKKAQELNHILENKTRENEYYKTIIDNFVCTFQTDKNGILTEASIKFCRLFDYEKELIVGENVNILRCESCMQESFQKMMLKAIHAKKTISSTHTFMTNSNRKIMCDVTMTPKYGRDALINGYSFYLDLV